MPPKSPFFKPGLIKYLLQFIPPSISLPFLVRFQVSRSFLWCRAQKCTQYSLSVLSQKYCITSKQHPLNYAQQCVLHFYCTSFSRFPPTSGFLRNVSWTALVDSKVLAKTPGFYVIIVWLQVLQNITRSLLGHEKGH